MGYELFIGLRYLRGKKKSRFVSVITFISILGITVGVTALIIVLSVMSGFQEDIKEKILGINAHIVISEFGGTIYDYDTVLKSSLAIEEVIGATPFTYNQAMLSTEDGVTGSIIRGIDTDTVGDVTILPERLKVGSLEGLNKTFREAAKEDDLPGIVVGRELAISLGAGLGDEVNIISPSGSSASGGNIPRMAAFKIVGVFELGMYEYDTGLSFISLKNAQTFFKHKGVSGIELKIADIYKAEEVSQKVYDALPGSYWTRTWMDMNRNLFNALKLEKGAMFIILTLIILVAALNIISSLIMIVMEKSKEIAILKSLGASSTSIMKIFMIDGIIIGVIGTALGVLLGVTGAVYLDNIVGLIEEIFNFKLLPPSVYYIDRLPSKVEPGSVVIIALISLGISFLATIYPSYKASKYDPVEGLRYE